MPLALPLQFLVVTCAGWISRQQQDVIEYLKTENAVQKELLGPGRLRLTDGQRRRLARAGHAIGRKILSQVATIVTPDTILGWFRDLIAKKYDGTARRGPGRPRIVEALSDLIVRLACENPTFGYTRLVHSLHNLGREVGRSTVERTLRERGIVPAPERRRKTSWKNFLATHWDGLFGADFFTVEVLTWAGLVRYHVFFLMELKTRRVHIGGISCDPCEEWFMQIARNLTDSFDGFLRTARFLILDRDPIFSVAFRRLLKDRGVRSVRLPPHSPNLNAYCERWVRSIRNDCLNRFIPLGAGHLRRAVKEYLAHYHAERNHQGLGGKLIDPEPGVGSREGRILCRMRLGGLLNYYYRRAA